MEILIILATGTLCIVCFLFGAKVGNSVSKGKEIELPTLNPIKAIKERREEYEGNKEQERTSTIFENMENYDGTNRGQKEVR